jgi:hypothetical protein
MFNFILAALLFLMHFISGLKNLVHKKEEVPVWRQVPFGKKKKNSLCTLLEVLKVFSNLIFTHRQL